MLLERVLEKNPGIVAAAVQLHQTGQIPAGSWLFDLDAVAHNARLISSEARRLGLTTYIMTKQIGRNPFVTALAIHMGIEKTVSVDMQCARLLHRYGLPIGHIGHLNQIPKHDVAAALAMRPDFWTVFSVEAAREIAAIARAEGVVQPLMVRVRAPGDVFFPGQEGGILSSDLLAAAREISALEGVRIAGVTTFPVLNYDFSGTSEIAFNPNMATITRAAKDLRDELGLDITCINAPGNTSHATLAMLREGGATHVEPGHGLFGTTPLQIVGSDHPELPAYVFVTEISHHYEGRAYGIANGGTWALQGHFLPDWRIGALVGSTPEAALANRMVYEHLDQIIDYHIPLLPAANARIGDTVVFPTYTQAHMTRAQVVPVSGISSGNPKVWGIFDQATTMLDEDWNPVPPAAVREIIEEMLRGYPPE
jgi:predicted amino acid racemase